MFYLYLFVFYLHSLYIQFMFYLYSSYILVIFCLYSISILFIFYLYSIYILLISYLDLICSLLERGIAQDALQILPAAVSVQRAHHVIVRLQRSQIVVPHLQRGDLDILPGERSFPSSPLSPRFVAAALPNTMLSAAASSSAVMLSAAAIGWRVIERLPD